MVAVDFMIFSVLIMSVWRMLFCELKFITKSDSVYSCKCVYTQLQGQTMVSVCVYIHICSEISFQKIED